MRRESFFRVFSLVGVVLGALANVSLSIFMGQELFGLIVFARRLIMPFLRVFDYGFTELVISSGYRYKHYVQPIQKTYVAVMFVLVLIYCCYLAIFGFNSFSLVFAIGLSISLKEYILGQFLALYEQESGSVFLRMIYGAIYGSLAIVLLLALPKTGMTEESFGNLYFLFLVSISLICLIAFYFAGSGSLANLKLRRSRFSYLYFRDARILRSRIAKSAFLQVSFVLIETAVVFLFFGVEIFSLMAILAIVFAAPQAFMKNFRSILGKEFEIIRVSRGLNFREILSIICCLKVGFATTGFLLLYLYSSYEENIMNFIFFDEFWLFRGVLIFGPFSLLILMIQIFEWVFIFYGRRFCLGEQEISRIIISVSLSFSFLIPLAFFSDYIDDFSLLIFMVLKHIAVSVFPSLFCEIALLCKKV